MSELVLHFAEWCAVTIEAIGISLITGFTLYTLLQSAVQLWQQRQPQPIFRKMRQKLGQGILLGLEFLVAADIIHTVAVELTFTTIGVLALVVLIRTFLSFTLELELTGHWPWHNQPHDSETQSGFM